MKKFSYSIILQHKKVNSQHLATSMGAGFYYNVREKRIKIVKYKIRFVKEVKTCELQFVMTKKISKSS